MKIKFLLLALLFPLASFGANTNVMDNVLIRNNWQFIGGSPGVGKFWISDAIGNGAWLTGSAAGVGDVFRASNNVYNVGTTQFMSHAVVSNTFTSVGMGTFNDGVSIGSNLVVNGLAAIGTNAVSGNVALLINSKSIGTTNLALKLFPGQTASFFKALSSTDIELVSISTLGNINTLTGDSAFEFTSSLLNLNASGSAATVQNISATANSSLALGGGSGAGSSITLTASGTQVSSFQTNMITLGTNSAVARVVIGPNTTSRGRGIVVGANAVTNSLIQGVSGTYGGSPTNITWPVTFATVPFVVGSTTTSGGTALGNDTFWVTNKTTTGCTVGYRNGAGVDSAATLTFDVHALGLQ